MDDAQVRVDGSARRGALGRGRPRLIVIGAGPMGLAVGYYAAKRGYQVEILEGDDRPGGMAAHFDFDGLSIERFYHFCCRGDRDTLELLAELGLGDAMRWVPTRMGYYVDGRLSPFGDPLSLLAFPALGPIEKLRYGLMAWAAVRRKDWSALDRISARDWIVGWCGQGVYDRLWRPLFQFKFYEHAEEVSAAWVWQRIQRLGRSRKSLFQEELGYIDGGSETLVNALASAIRGWGGRIRLRCPARKIATRYGAVVGVVTGGGDLVEADAVVSTVPLPVLASLLKEEAPALAETYAGFTNIGAACVVHRLKRSVTPYFWVNVSDPAIQAPGFVEFSHLRPCDETIVYMPYYMPTTHPKFGWADERLAEESFGYLERVNPGLTDEDRIGSRVGRLRYAQPVCGPGFAERLPPVRTPIQGLHAADTSFYYPEDRGVSESVRFAKILVDGVVHAR
jgi:protoporphyrinogen oxidase